MKYVCVTNIYKDLSIAKELTIGQQYDKSTFDNNTGYNIVIVLGEKNIRTYPLYLFKSVVDFRDGRIDELLKLS